ncbi:MAG TPA: carbohydrate binding family 9 domain-containing protein [Gammaproteobacteria bacterium]|nr:carbohydrate binding family 9 domain-containing protein [Gammaproteobacteria bacterium]
MVRTATPPVIDGKLDEAVWQTADVITDFHQIRPGDGSTPSEPTEVYLLYDDDAFYIGARMHDSEPQLIVAPTNRHNQGLGPDDRLVVIFDPFNTGRSGYRFETNPNGVRHDALYTTTNSFQGDWTVIWDTAATIDETGWVAEMAIPFKSLPFDPNTQDWGFNFGRGIRRRGEEMAWVSRNRTYNPSILGVATGLQGMNQGVGLDVVPSLAVGDQKTFVSGSGGDTTDSHTSPSLDVFYRFTPSLNGALTINTDFSATEVDARQVNLTRFNLFFPEKRDFFLADADLFQFGRISGNGSNDSNEATSQPSRENARPFFSRRIGLSASGTPVDIEYGGKLSGRVGRFSLGSLAISQDAFGSAGQPGYVEAQDLFVGRVSANVLEESNVGIVVTDGNPQSNVDNSVVGADFHFLNSRIAGGRALEADAWYQQSETPGLVGDDAAFGIGVNMPNTAGLRGGFAVKEIERNFNPALGFISRADVRDMAFDVGYTKFFTGGKVQRLNAGVDWQRFDLLNGGGRQSDQVVFKLLELETPARDAMRLRYSTNEEIVAVPFNVYVDSSDPARNVTIGVGRYTFDEASIRLATGNQRVLSGNVTYLAGDFYNGERTNVSGQFSWKPSRHFILNLDYDWNDVTLPQGDFVTRLVGLSTQVMFSTNLAWITLMQYDNVSEVLGINTRLHWIPKAGQEGFIVLNHNLQDYDKDASFRSAAADVSVKFKYTFRF